MDLGTEKPASNHGQPARRWLSFALIVAGLGVLVVAAGLLWWTQRPAPEPPPSLGLADNPLPVVSSEPSVDPSPDSLAASVASTSQPAVTSEPDAVPTPMVLPVVPELPVRIVAPAIALDAPVVPVGWKTLLVNGKQANVWEVAENAAGWHKGSALPGQVGNTVISGHHNTGGEVFRYVVDLEPGDEVMLYTDSRAYTYTVESRLVVPDRDESPEKRRENARWIANYPDERLTLVTCWPYNTNTHRVIVVARPAS